MKILRGTTLLEVIITMIIIVVIAIVGLEFIRQCSLIVRKAELRLIAANFAREKMEELYMTNYGHLFPGAYTSNWLPENVFTPPFLLAPLRNIYSGDGSYTVEIDKDAANNEYKIITSTVTWVD